jgi:hypothetical protein
MTVLNSVLDIAFTADMILQFFIAYEIEDPENKKFGYETNHFEIMKRYCALPFCKADPRGVGKGGWFWLDIATNGPAWAIRYFGKAEDQRFVGVVRCLRLLRLAHLGHVARSLKLGWNRNVGFSMQRADELKDVFFAFVTCHYFALFWMAIEGRTWIGVIYQMMHGQVPSERESWLSVLEDAKGGDVCYPSAAENGFCVYTLSMYWTFMTLTGTGYGDITALTIEEYTFSAVCILFTGFLWAYVGANIISHASSGDPERQAMMATMSEMSDVCADNKIPADIARNCRAFIMQSWHSRVLNDQVEGLGGRVSSRLMEEVLAERRGQYLSKVFWAQDLPTVAKLAMMGRMRQVNFSAKEELTSLQTLLIVRQGYLKVMPKLRRVGPGEVWGEVNILLVSHHLLNEFPVALTFVDALSLTQESLREVCDMFPAADMRVRRAQIRVAFWRQFIKEAASMERARNAVVASVVFRETQVHGVMFSDFEDFDEFGEQLNDALKMFKDVIFKLNTLKAQQEDLNAQLLNTSVQVAKLARLRRRRRRAQARAMQLHNEGGQLPDSHGMPTDRRGGGHAGPDLPATNGHSSGSTKASDSGRTPSLD